MGGKRSRLCYVKARGIEPWRKRLGDEGAMSATSTRGHTAAGGSRRKGDVMTHRPFIRAIHFSADIGVKATQRLADAASVYVRRQTVQELFSFLQREIVHI